MKDCYNYCNQFCTRLGMKCPFEENEREDCDYYEEEDDDDNK